MCIYIYVCVRVYIYIHIHTIMNIQHSIPFPHLNFCPSPAMPVAPAQRSASVRRFQLSRPVRTCFLDGRGAGLVGGTKALDGGSGSLLKKWR